MASSRGKIIAFRSKWANNDFFTFKNFQNVYWHGKRHSILHEPTTDRFCLSEWSETTQSLISRNFCRYILSSRWSSFVPSVFVYRLAWLAVLVFLRQYLCLTFTNRWLIFYSLNKTNKWVFHTDGWTIFFFRVENGKE